MKILAEKRGPLQGIDAPSIIRAAFGPDAKLVESPEETGLSTIVDGNGDVLDTVLDIH
ncbi:hypothetical protein SEA_PUPPER_176 [Gordonia phage Pupper]|uniref:Uncharacterized protein n=1 Tax=Gordonia phage Pupper TaxID=2571249 RepID=A0A4Y6EJL5_9CAUD|nr:hypothetical protein KHQ83_gp101 [Gordonia phage Pupper]QDF18662.1 hypothetical protein SEA_PUPPER_176 [Gordonia phage Pupper]QDF18894.1 hypothetical protein SEA_SCENTAE_175 [Gordonia phage SCentae]